MNDIKLYVSNRVYSGWTEMEIGLGIEQIAGHFTLQLTDKWDEQKERRPIQPGEPCRVELAGAIVITGYIDDAIPEYDEKSHIVQVSGRDKTADLVDCSAIHGSGQWANRDLLQIAIDLCSPFGIKVVAKTNVGAPFKTWKIEEGETVFDCIERAARIRGLLLYTDGQGQLIIGKAGTERTAEALILGENILASSGGFSHIERYSKIIVKGDHAGSDDAWGDEVIGREGVAVDPWLDIEESESTIKVTGSDTDSRIARYRPLIILAEDQVNNAEAQQRADWEVNRRYGQSLSVTYTVQNWVQSNGKIWPINQLVKVQDAWKGIDATLLISEVSFTLDSAGKKTEITVTRPEAFDTIPLKEKVEKTNKKKEVESWAV